MAKSKKSDTKKVIPVVITPESYAEIQAKVEQLNKKLEIYEVFELENTNLKNVIEEIQKEKLREIETLNKLVDSEISQNIKLKALVEDLNIINSNNLKSMTTIDIENRSLRITIEELQKDINTDIKHLTEKLNIELQKNVDTEKLQLELKQLNEIYELKLTEIKTLNQQNNMINVEKVRLENFQNIVKNTFGKATDEIIPYIQGIISENNSIRNILVNKELFIEKLQNGLIEADSKKSTIDSMKNELMSFKRNELVLKATITNLEAKLNKIKSTFN